jgi:hypothetical protein
MSENTSENTVQVALDGSVLLVHRDDVVRDSGGKVSGVRPRGHCNGSEARAPKVCARPRTSLPVRRQRGARVTCPVGRKLCRQPLGAERLGLCG